MPYQAKTLQLLIENARDYAIVMMDAEGRITLWNTGAENVLGWQEAEIVGQPAAVFFTPEDRAAGSPERELRAAREEGRAEDERWHIRKDGSRFWGSGLVFPVVDEGLRGYLKIFRDLTEQKRHEQELEDVQLRLQAALNAGEIGTWTWDIAAGRMYADPNLARFFSLSPEAANGGPVEQYLRVIHPDDQDRVKATFAAAIENRSRYDCEHRLVNPDGSLCWLIASGSVECDAQGHPINLRGAALNVTTLREAEQAQRQAQAQAEHQRRLLDAVLDALPAGVVIADATGKVVRFNAAFERIWGDNLPRVQDMTDAREYVGYWHATGKRLEPHEWAMARALQGEDCPGELVEIEKFDGSGRSVTFHSAAPVRNAAGEIIGGVVAQIDVTAQVRAEEALRRHQAEIEALNVRLRRAMQETHHRIKNNLQVIVALVEMQAEELGDNAAVERIKQHVHTLATIHDLLTQQAKVDTDMSIVSANAVLQRLIPMLQATSGDRRIKADVNDVVLSVQKATSLSLLVSECVSNAINHGKGDMEITLRVQDSTVRLEVYDDGPGFPPDFNPRKAAHTGMELINSTAQWDLRGEVHYENRDEGGGRVVVTFPIDMPTES